MKKIYTPFNIFFQSGSRASHYNNFVKPVFSLFIFLLLFLFIPNKINASHIVGGTLTYTFNGGTNYTVKLLLYRDCSGVAFPVNAPITVLQADGTLFAPSRNFTLPGGAITVIPAVLPPCATSPSVIPCVEQRVYTATVSLPASPGGMHLYYSVCCRNPSVNNILTPGAVGETFYAFIPCYRSIWVEDFTLPNGTTVDVGPTAWTRAITGVLPVPTAAVNTGSFEVISQNSAAQSNIVWASQVIAINTFTNGVNLSVNYSEPVGNTLGNGDSIRVFYSINGGAKVLFPLNGQRINDFDANIFATASGLVGLTVQVFVRIAFDALSPNTELYHFDMVSVYDNTFLPNSNPAFTNLPPLLFCATNPFNINHSATDADGDSLVYSMYTPLIDAPAPTFPNNIFAQNTVTFSPGYSAISPFNAGGPNVTLGALTGLMTGVANTLGQFVFGVKCQEFRKAKLLSEMTRDYEVNTVTCPPFVPPAPIAGANTPLCVGQTLNLTASPVAGATYSWTGPAGFTSTLQNPSIVGVTLPATGIYSVTATVAGCTGPAGTVAVVVNPIPASSTAGANTPLCAGQTLSLTATVVAGAVYTWAGPNTFTSAVQNPTIGAITVLASGIYSVTSTVLGCAGTPGTVNVVVNPLPAAPLAGSNSPICAGQTLNLTASAIAGATYSWNGPNSFTSAVQNPTLPGATILASGIYSVTATVLGCAGSAGTVSVLVNPAPAAPVAGANTPLCVGQTLNLTASAIAGATYNWNGPNSFTSAVQNPSLPAVTILAAGVYSVTATVAGCPGPSGTITVVVNPAPAAPVAGSNSPLCAGQTINLTASLIAGATYNWTGPNSFTSAVQNPTIPGATILATGMYSVTATVAGCPGPAGTVSVTVNPIPAAPVAGANTPLCAGQNLNLTASLIAGATYTWAGPNAFTSGLQNPTIVGATILASGTYSVNVTVAGCAGPSGTVSVTVNPLPAAPVAGANTPLCVGQTLNLTASFIAGATYTWTGPNAFTSALQNPSLPGVTLLAAGVYSVRANVLGCAGPSGTVNVVVNPIPAAPVAGSNSPLCAGSTLNLTASAIAGATYNWNGPNSFTSAVQNPTLPGATVLASGVYSVNATVAGCAGPSGTVNVLVNPIPASPVAGANTPLCVGQTLNLTASLIAGATYTWTGPNAFGSALQNPSIPAVTLLATGVYSVRATVLGCGSPFGTVSVIVNPTPAAPVAGGTATLCAGSTINLTASFIAGVTYNWTGPNSFTSTVQNPSIPGASTLATGMYSVTATSGLGCTGPAGTFSVTVFGIPAPPTLGSNSPLCTGQTLSLTATPVAGATYNWTGPNTFTSTLQNPTIAAVTLAANGIYSVLVTVSGCGSANSTVAVTVNPTPAAPVAGANTPLCVGSTLNLTASLIAGATYSWTGPNTFTANVQNPSLPGVVILSSGIYSVNASALGCTGPNGTVNVVVNPIPTAPVAGANTPLCSGSTLNLTASAIAGATYNWNGPNSFTAAVQNPTLPGATVLASGVYSVNVTVLGCAGPSGTVNVTVNPIPASPIAGANTPLCVGQTLSLTSSTVAGATYTWTGPNTFTSNIQNPTIAGVTLLASGVYSVRATVLGCGSPIATISVVVNPTPAAPVAGGTATLCAGSTINLTASFIAGVTYNWTGPNSFTSTVQNPSIPGASTLATGMYSVTATNALGCTGPAGTFSVNVFGIPSPPVLGSNSPVCTGQTLSLTASPVAGASYNWTGPNTFTSNLQNPTIAGVPLAANGIYSVLVSVSGCGSASSTLAVTVNATPAAPVAGSNSPLCAGQTINLTASLIAGATYSWTGPNTFTANVQNPSVINPTTTASGIYSVNANVLGCVGPNGTVNVLVNPTPAAPTAGANTPLCAGSTINLTASPIGGATYSWTGPNSFTSAVQNPTIPGATILASGVYSVNATVAGCAGPSGTINVIVNPIPSAPVAANNAPICAGQTLSLTASTIAGATYSWTGPNTFTSNIQNPSIINATIAASGIYTVSVNVLGCNSANATTTVLINPTPAAPTPGSNSPICLGQTINLTASTIAGAVYNWTGPNTFTSTTQNPTIPGATTLATGVYSITSTVAGCTSITNTVSVLVSIPATVTANSNQTVCANNGTTTISGTSTTGSGIWTTSGSGIFSPNNTTLTTNYIPSTADNAVGSVTITLTSTNNGGCASANSQIIINITPSPTVNAGPNQAICANNSTVALSGTVTIASGGIWSTLGTGTFSPNNTILNPTYVPSALDVTTGSVVIVLTSTGNGNCFPATDTMIITFFPAPVVNAGPNIQFVCKNNPNYNLVATSTTGFGVWTTLGTGTFTPNNTILNPTYLSSTADTTAGFVFIIFTSTNNGTCNGVNDTIKLVYTGTITIGAGTSQTLCANNSTIALTATCTTGFGTWTTSGTGIFSPNTLTGNYIPSAADIALGMVTLTVTSGNNGTCNPVKDVVTMYFTPSPQANAGINQTVCANNGTVTLAGSFTIATGGIWTSSGTGTFSPNNTTMNANYIPSNADTTAGIVTLTLTTTGNGNCIAVTSTMQILFTPAPLVNAGANIFVCKNNANAILSGYSSTGTGTWTTLGSGVFSPNNTILNPTYIPSTADTTAGSVFLILTSTGNGACNPTTDTIKITFSNIPTVTAGLSQTVCANNATVTLNGTSTTGFGTWTTSGTGLFAPNTLTGTYIPSAADTTAGIVTLTLTSTNNGGCAAVMNQMTVSITPAPFVFAGTDQTICANSNSVILSGTVAVASGGIWTTSGTGTFSPNNTSLATGYIPSAADTTAGVVTIYLTTTGNGNCVQVIDSMQIIFNSAPLVDAGPIALFACKNNPNVQLNGTTTAATYTWTTLGTGIFNPGNTILNPTYNPSAADTTAGNVTLVLTAGGTGACFIVTDTVKLFFQSQPKANFTFANRCVNAATTFTDLSSAGTGTIVTWLWNFGASTSTVQNASNTFTSTGNQTVSLVVSTGCKDSITKTIFINPLPATSFTFTALCHDSAQFASTTTITPGAIAGWTWNFGDLGSSILQNPFHVYADTGMYIITLTAISDSGCVAASKDTIHILPCGDNPIIISNPAVPTGFSPNGDGKNDVLLVKGGPFKSLDFRIFNEWGNQIFRSDAQSVGWDGTFINVLQTAGRYIWTVSGEVIDGRQIKMTGEVILTR